MTVSEEVRDVQSEQAEAFVGRLFEAAVGGWELLTTHLGLELGLYAALDEAPAGLTTTVLAEATGVHPRYVGEWLEQQVVAGVVEVDDAAAAPGLRTFTLPPAHAAVLLDEHSPFHAAPLAHWTATIPALLPQLMEPTAAAAAWRGETSARPSSTAKRRSTARCSSTPSPTTWQLTFPTSTPTSRPTADASPMWHAATGGPR